NRFMVRLRGRSKIIWLIDTLLMIIHMNMRHPFIVYSHALATFQLRLPRPVAVEIKIVMIGSATRPWFTMFPGIKSWVVVCADDRIIPIYISVPSVRIYAGINNDNRIFHPFFGLAI